MSDTTFKQIHNNRQTYKYNIPSLLNNPVRIKICILSSGMWTPVILEIFTSISEQFYASVFSLVSFLAPQYFSYFSHAA
jgi:hypothetical protein